MNFKLTMAQFKNLDSMKEFMAANPKPTRADYEKAFEEISATKGKEWVQMIRRNVMADNTRKRNAAKLKRDAVREAQFNTFKVDDRISFRRSVKSPEEFGIIKSIEGPFHAVVSLVETRPSKKIREDGKIKIRPCFDKPRGDEEINEFKYIKLI